MKKNILKIMLAVVIALSLSVVMVPPARTMAADSININVTGSESCAGLVGENFTVSLLINCYVNKIFTFLTEVAVAISVIMIIVSGFLFITSAGSPDKVKTANQALTGALIGLVIVLVSYSIVLFEQDLLQGGVDVNVNQPVNSNTVNNNNNGNNNNGNGNGQVANPVTIPDSVKSAAANGTVTFSAFAPINTLSCSDIQSAFKSQSYYEVGHNYNGVTYPESNWTFYIKGIHVQTSDTGVASGIVTVYYTKAYGGTIYSNVWTRSGPASNAYYVNSRSDTPATDAVQTGCN